MSSRLLGAVVALGIAGAAGFACGGSSNESGGEGGGEAALVSVSDPATGITWKYPGTWTRTSESPLTFSGQDEYVSLEVRPLAGADVLAAAKADEGALRSATPGYKGVGLAVSTEVKDSAVTGYEWDLAKSAVTGKPVHQRADRYYINLGNGNVAILTGSSPSTRFDREQVRDIALTVRVTK